ncbi:MAG: TetR/AcrR family transcriptional regulator [Salinisphaera sp.]|jgi:AcrR family transcriptional regulator|nr:TetR/AcrR family transcriptional regulator [Salinisphaera sp.]
MNQSSNCDPLSMGRRSEHTRRQLSDLILQAAEQLIVDHGLAGLSARAIARDIGYTPGTIYLLFANLDDVILHVNARTLDALYAYIKAAIAKERSPLRQLMQAARAYVEFARTHPNRWRACFEHRLPVDVAGPDDIDVRIQQLIDLIMAPLADVSQTEGAALDAAAQALWSGVHGICILTLTHKLQMVGGREIEHLTDNLVRHYLVGLAASDASTDSMGP